MPMKGPEGPGGKRPGFPGGQRPDEVKRKTQNHQMPPQQGAGMPGGNMGHQTPPRQGAGMAGGNMGCQTPPPPRHNTGMFGSGTGRQTPPPPPAAHQKDSVFGTTRKKSALGLGLGAAIGSLINEIGKSVEEAKEAGDEQDEMTTIMEEVSNETPQVSSAPAEDYSSYENYPSICPQCGAPTSGLKNCEYCNTRLI